MLLQQIKVALTVAAVLGSCNSPPSRITPPGPDTGTPAPTATVLHNAALVLTMDPALGEGPLGMIEGGDVRFENGQITAVGANLARDGATAIDATGKIVMPGFVDVHNHLWQTLIRGCGIDKHLLDWLPACVFPMNDAGITKDEAYAVTRLGTYDVIDTGVTTVMEFSHGFTVEFGRGDLEAVEDSGLRFAFALCGQRDRFDELRSIKARIDQNPLGSFQVCSHPANYLQDWVNGTTELAKELGVYLNVHLNEHIGERNDEPMTSLAEAGAFDGKLLVDHAIHMTDEEIAILAQHDVRVAHNPASNMRLASGVFRMREMLDAGIKIGLGLDGGANDTSDMFANMRAAVGLQRAVKMDATASPTVEEVLRMATMGGAEVLDLQDTIGSLTPGKRADVIVIDPGATNFAPRWNWLSQIVFNGQPRNVEWVFVDGRPLKAEGKLVGDDIAEVVAAAERAAERIKGILDARP